MTVDGTLYRETESLVLPAPRILYPAEIPVTHWQLRSLVSSPSPGLLYYPDNHLVFCLNTVARKRKLVACLPFSPRCLTVRYGWLCAGGADNGQFAALKLPGMDFEDADDSDLLLGLGHPWRGRPGLLPDGSIGLAIRTKELGGSIVNSVTIYRPRTARDDRSTVAVLTNNDKTIRIFSLAQFALVATLELEVAVNHATISPDGEHLVAVGDSQDVYFFKPTGPTSRSFDPSHRWEMYLNPPLRAGTDALFSTAFSPSSQLCAVASQDGTVTIFDTRYTGCSTRDAVVRSIPSSRPGTTAGAVRSINFSPDPWDLLVWTEHCGRICVLDARDDFQSRQLIDLTAEAGTVERAQVVGFADDLMLSDLRREQTDPADIRSVYRQFREARALAEHTIGRFSSLRDEDDVPSSDPRIASSSQSNFPRESTVFERPTSINYLPPPSASRSLSTPFRDFIRDRNPQRDRDLPRYDSSRYLADARSVSNPTERTGSNPPQQRSQTQTGPTDPGLTIEAALATGPVFHSPYPQLDRDLPRYDSSRYLADARSVSNPTEGTGSDPRQQRSQTQTGPITDPWLTIEAALATGRLLRDREVSFEANFQRRREVWMRMEERRSQRLRGLQAEVEASGYTDRYRGSASGGDVGVSITGCSFSGDGRKLYVGTEEGIVEYHINIQERKFFPRVTPR